MGQRSSREGERDNGDAPPAGPQYGAYPHGTAGGQAGLAPVNHITEVQVLCGHSDVVRHLTTIEYHSMYVDGGREKERKKKKEKKKGGVPNSKKPPPPRDNDHVFLFFLFLFFNSRHPIALPTGQVVPRAFASAGDDGVVNVWCASTGGLVISVDVGAGLRARTARALAHRDAAAAGAPTTADGSSSSTSSSSSSQQQPRQQASNLADSNVVEVTAAEEDYTAARRISVTSLAALPGTPFIIAGTSSRDVVALDCTTGMLIFSERGRAASTAPGSPSLGSGPFSSVAGTPGSGGGSGGGGGGGGGSSGDLSICRAPSACHDGSVTCITALPSLPGLPRDSPAFCTGGNDALLHMWSISRGIHGTREHMLTPEAHIPRQDAENLHCMLAVTRPPKQAPRDQDVPSEAPVTFIITGSDSPNLTAYGLVSRRSTRMPPAHRESVRSLSVLSVGCFCSGSLDGVVVLWSPQLKPLHVLNVHDVYVYGFVGFFVGVFFFFLVFDFLFFLFFHIIGPSHTHTHIHIPSPLFLPPPPVSLSHTATMTSARVPGTCTASPARWPPLRAAVPSLSGSAVG
jgi:hypothetical protein